MSGPHYLERFRSHTDRKVLKRYQLWSHAVPRTTDLIFLNFEPYRSLLAGEKVSSTSAHQ